ncbi:sigma-70 family RNA polymerase sigma factor [Microbulbifer sp. OS29]|uniref:Sigma-70 family RNA polymerase sigma factor n=1 Tax=Microbulbifer okhotskensis TaxID=2926617 RepID=A0A9X2EPV8_9GAMM|nr:sigma-70 family RNA polymerase sigma factor [Microbulbifer okhotskensis]MCO1335150.1 sigma-70 family RNA polymerase sigma factor [Microbulbifer okhotskensis]
MENNYQNDVAQWVVKYGLGLRRYFASRVNLSDVDDLVQEVFTQLFVRITRHGKDIDNPKIYIYAVAKNLLISHGRHQKTRCGALHDSIDCKFDIPYLISPERTVMGIQAYSRVLEAILGLPPRAGTAFRFHRFEGMTYQAIAEQMGISKESVKELIQRALVRVRQAVEEAS